MRDLVGRTLGHYRVVKQIGAGGMGVVYRAHDERLDRDVAIKVLAEEVAADPDRLARFEREAKAVAKLNHPNILAIHDFGTEDGVAYAVMELLEGESLREVISTDRLTAGKSVEYTRAIADGLAAAHEKGIVHRDLKPENVFLTRDGRIKILDFGLAKLHLPEQDLATETPTATLETQPGGLLGTVAYMAPEQVRGLPADDRSDIFAVGVVLYEMLTGHRPFGGSNSLETAAAILKEDAEPISAVSPTVPPALGSVVAQCLEKRPEDRFSSAHDLSLTLGAVDSAASGTVGPKRSSRRWHWPVVAVVAIAALIGFLFLPFPRGEKPIESVEEDAPPRIVVLPFENLGAAEDEFFADGVTEEITARLASMQGLRVISRTSAVNYADSDKSIQEMGDELDVDYVLEGTVRWARGEEASRIRITPQLIRVEDDSNLWAETFDRVLDDVFEVQSEIAKQVTDQLGVTLAGSELAAVELQPTDNVDAYQAYLQGRYYATRPHFTYENWSHAMTAWERAAELDPDFALAQAELARGHALLHFFRHDLTPERLEAADAAAARALELGPDSLRVRLALGYYHLWGYRDRERALEEFSRAEEGLPDNAEILAAKAHLFELEGRWDEALDAYERAFELSPRDADMIVQAAGALWVLRRYPEAVIAADEAIHLAPDAMWPYLYKILVLWSWKGSPGATRTLLEALPENSGDWGRWAWYWQEVFEGRHGEALRGLQSASGDWIRIKIVARPNALLAAQAYDLLGDAEKASSEYEISRQLLEAEVASSPEDPRLRSSLGLAYAALGRREEAIREGIRATELLTREDDGFYYLPYVVDLAHIYTLVGDYGSALDQIEYLLTNPSWISPAWLEMDPRWRPLRDNPRYQALIEQHSTQQ